MNCDDAFDALTDPACATAAELAEHLAACPRCRELKQVLEPALSLLCGDLPLESAIPEALTNEALENDHAGASQKRFLTVDAVGVAEAAAARLASLNAPSENPPAVRLSKKRLSGRALQGVLCAAFGGLAVFCVGLWGGKADVSPQLSPAPSVIPAGACTRNAVPKKATKTRTDARAVILSCVACHMQDHQPRNERLSTSLFRSIRHAVDRVLIVSRETEVVNDHGPILKIDFQEACRQIGRAYA